MLADVGVFASGMSSPTGFFGFLYGSLWVVLMDGGPIFIFTLGALCVLISGVVKRCEVLLIGRCSGDIIGFQLVGFSLMYFTILGPIPCIGLGLFVVMILRPILCFVLPLFMGLRLCTLLCW